MKSDQQSSKGNNLAKQEGRVLHCGIKELRAESQGFSLTHQISVLRHRDGLFFNPVAWAAMTDFNRNTLRPDPTVLLSR